ncbi:hypothetical protein EMIHUDRAFT_227352 [Emiliania huxleyi CCMP1516]|uniref:Protein nlrc3 n=2 Tax=Emiliania huxleyi TaxID=2903 RepID=A0A0D3KJ58_EMIH1|nr:hypothetical protein EMIHUDRAFT_227352 [Emiliania huxleyi CCMP1516]EOD35793.1 hypothetical protein EMIHUDRAFT_227352 [Emiliania huxleyi CCMP1516]|eukprot:XP_005788222.1 hypothetical protein EMIHUDRAFT_227352 [Emiliania huxleyi CCMP1516]
MAAEVRRGVADEAAEEASQLVRVHLGLERCADAGGAADTRLEAPLGDKAEAYNHDLRFQAAVGDALKASGVDLTGLDLGSDDGVMVGTVVAWMESEPSALTSLTLDWGKVCGRVREALLGAVRKTHTLVALSVGEERAMPLNPLQLNGREAVPSLDLSGKRLGPASAAVVAAGVSVNGVLTSLNLGFNDLTEEAALGIVRVERQRNKLTSLSLARCSIGPTGAAEIAEYVSGSAVLTTLALPHNSIGAEGAAAIAEALRGNGVMTTLNLKGNNIRAEGAAALASALRVNGVLTSLDVGSNGLTEEAALGIVRVERQRNKLTSLALENCGIGPTGAAEIAEYVSGSAVLTSLNLCNNNIHVTGAIAIAEALRGNGVLTNLDLSGNNIGGETDYIKASEVEGESKEVGAKVVYQGREMVVSEGVDSDGELKLADRTGILAIAKALEVNGVLTSIDLRGNNLSDEGKKAIQDAVSGREGFKLEM